jgi:hypothetical protein
MVGDHRRKAGLSTQAATWKERPSLHAPLLRNLARMGRGMVGRIIRQGFIPLTNIPLPYRLLLVRFTAATQSLIRRSRISNGSAPLPRKGIQFTEMTKCRSQRIPSRRGRPLVSDRFISLARMGRGMVGRIIGFIPLTNIPLPYGLVCPSLECADSSPSKP